MQTVTKSVQDRLVSILTQLRGMVFESAAINRDYFATDASAKVDGLANNTDCAAVDAKLNKLQYLQGVTICDQLSKFFTNVATAQANYIANCASIVAAEATGSVRSLATEQVGSRIKTLVVNLTNLQADINRLIAVYNGNQLSTAFGSLDVQRQVFGADMTVSQLLSAMTLCQDLNNLLTNVSAPQGYYGNTIAAWENLLG